MSPDIVGAHLYLSDDAHTYSATKGGLLFSDGFVRVFNRRVNDSNRHMALAIYYGRFYICLTGCV